MDWENIRGSSIKNKTEKQNHKDLERKIIFEVNKKLNKFKKKYTLSANNRYGKWEIK